MLSDDSELAKEMLSTLKHFLDVQNFKSMQLEQSLNTSESGFKGMKSFICSLILFVDIFLTRVRSALVDVSGLLLPEITKMKFFVKGIVQLSLLNPYLFLMMKIPTKQKDPLKSRLRKRIT
jgi:hypothetical protein